VFTRARHLPLSWAKWIQSTSPNHISLRSILTLSSHQRLGLPSGLLPSDLPTKMLYAPLTSPMRATCPAHLILLALITLTTLGEKYKPCSSSLWSFLQPPVISSLLGPNIHLSTLFSNTLNLCSSHAPVVRLWILVKINGHLIWQGGVGMVSFSITQCELLRLTSLPYKHPS
jgi:hypothetical protein